MHERAGTAEVFHAVVPEREAEHSVIAERIEELSSLRALLEALDGDEIREQERQVEYLKLRREPVEHRRRRRDHLDLPERERFERLAVLHELPRRIDLDADAPRESLLGKLLEALRRLPLRSRGRRDVRELDDKDLLLVRAAVRVACTAATRQRGREQPRRETQTTRAFRAMRLSPRTLMDSVKNSLAEPQPSC